MKKISTLFLALVMVLNILAVPVSAAEPLERNMELIQLPYKEDVESHAMKIRSVDELERYLDEYYGVKDTELKNTYDESFFAQKRLVFALVSQTGSSPKFEITSVEETYFSIDVFNRNYNSFS